MISYRAAAERLYKLGRLAQIANTYRELVGPLPEAGSLAELPLFNIMKKLAEKLETMFPVHYDMLYDYARDDDAILEIPFAHFVHFGGLDAEPHWEDWDPPFQLVFALFEAGNSGPDFSAYSGEAFRWWIDQMQYYDLPPLADLDYGRIRGRLESLPQPWDGLWAIVQWAEGDTGNFFVDVPCEYACEMSFDLDWSLDSIRWLEDQYRQAEQIFGPAWCLVEICHRHSEALGICFDLALGRPPRNGWVFRDGELAIMELDYEQR